MRLISRLLARFGLIVLPVGRPVIRNVTIEHGDGFRVTGCDMYGVRIMKHAPETTYPVDASEWIGIVNSIQGKQAEYPA